MDNDLAHASIGLIIQIMALLLLVQLGILTIVLTLKNKMTKDRLQRFFAVLIIGSLSSMIPFGPLGLFLGFPSVLLSAILVSVFLDKAKKEQ